MRAWVAFWVTPIRDVCIVLKHPSTAKQWAGLYWLNLGYSASKFTFLRVLSCDRQA